MDSYASTFNQVISKQLPTLSICRATNLYGSDETRGFVNTTGRPGIIYESQLPKGMASIERIREMESGWQRAPGMCVGFLQEPNSVRSRVGKDHYKYDLRSRSLIFCCTYWKRFMITYKLYNYLRSWSSQDQIRSENLLSTCNMASI